MSVFIFLFLSSIGSTAACGNSVVTSPEQCDNGGQRGCSASCTIVNGFYCAGSPSICAQSSPFASATGTNTGVLRFITAVQPQASQITQAIVNDIGLAFITSSNVIINQNSITNVNGVWQVPFEIAAPTANVGSLPDITVRLQNAANNAASSIRLSNLVQGGIAFNNLCGDGTVQLGEQCDDGGRADGCGNDCNPDSGFVCRSTLVLDSITGLQRQTCTTCSNRIVESARGEQCDDGNSVNGDGCSSQCLSETATRICGDAIYQSGEGCDDGNLFSGDGCTSTCGIENGFQCTQVVGTRSVCTLIAASTCGNGIVEGLENCDDGNFVVGDGCNSACNQEVGWVCTNVLGTRSTCRKSCGNGVVEVNEGCDDGNDIDGDGCSRGCLVESGYRCVANAIGRSVCSRIGTCGNGVVDSGEQCDDQNVVSGDGCSSICFIESGFYCSLVDVPTRCFSGCGDSIVRNGEPCDDGNLVNGDGCSTFCTIESSFTCTISGTRSICNKLALSAVFSPTGSDDSLALGLGLGFGLCCLLLLLALFLFCCLRKKKETVVTEKQSPMYVHPPPVAPVEVLYEAYDDYY